MAPGGNLWRWLVVGALVGLCACDDEADNAAAGAGASGSGAGGSGGSMMTGSGGDGAAGGSEGGSAGAGGGGPSKSAGCGLVNPASGALTIDVSGQDGDYMVSVPAGYDPDAAYPLGFAFHGAGRTGPQCQAGDCAGFQSVMEDDVVLVYMTSIAGPSWGDDYDLNADFFVAVLDHMLDAYCIDTDRVFAAGTSSGAHFSNVLGCRFGDRLAAIAPVAGYLPESQGCVESVAALVIHGIIDSHVAFSSGEQARDFWRARNGCTDVTVPPIADVHAAVLATDESHGCAVYQGCQSGLPVTWCEHSEGGYDGTTHGWPLFGGQQIWDFVSAL